jgi:predicted nucleic acid-binding protein
LNELIVADAGPLIALARIDAIGVLAKVHARVVVPDAVTAECLADRAKPGVTAIEAAFERGWLVAQPESPRLSGLQIATLGAGEAAAIELAELLDAILLIDERRGRAVAAARGLRVIGTLAVLVAARRREIVPRLLPLIVALGDAGYRVSEALIEAALASVGETRS